MHGILNNDIIIEGHLEFYLITNSKNHLVMRGITYSCEEDQAARSLCHYEEIVSICQALPSSLLFG